MGDGSTTLMERGQCLVGLFVFLCVAGGIGWVRARRAGGVAGDGRRWEMPWRTLVGGMVLSFGFAVVVLYAPGFLAKVQFAVDQLLAFTKAGAGMVFGNLAGMDAPVVDPASGAVMPQVARVGSIVAFVVLPTILFVSTLTAILYHTGVLTLVVHGLAWVMTKTVRCSGAEAMSTAANIFVGQTEAPLLIRPFLAGATRSELMVIMVGGFANIATGVLVVYAEVLGPFIKDIGGHLAAACFISAPVTLVVGKLLMPETGRPETGGTETGGAMRFKVEKIDANLIDAATRGTSEGLLLALNVGAMLVAFTALVALLNAVYGGAWGWAGVEGATLERHLGYLLAPVAWLCGVSWSEAPLVGQLLAKKTVLNEFLAYLDMGAILTANPEALSERSRLLTAYALCGFANVASIGIQVGGISVLAPTRRADLSRLGAVAMVGGFLATCIGACVVGLVV